MPRSLSSPLPVHATLTVSDVEVIEASKQRLLNAATLFQVGLRYKDDDVMSLAEVAAALRDVADVVREEATRIGVCIEQAHARSASRGGAR
jgi:hypothetical protein